MGSAALKVLGALLIATPFFLHVQAHCPNTPPEVEMLYPAPGISIQKACYVDYGNCFIDTFYSEKLKEDLVAKFTGSKFAVVAYVDSISSYLSYDTTFYHGQVYNVDTFQTEKVWIGIASNLKEPLPVKRLSFIDQWIPIPGFPLATTYTPLIDTPFVAFFSQYDSIREIGLGPMDGCFYEPTAYTIVQDSIHKKGAVGARMPGVAMGWKDFITAIGVETMDAPMVRIRNTGISGKPIQPRESRLNISGRPRYNLMGRRKLSSAKDHTSPWSWSFPEGSN